MFLRAPPLAAAPPQALEALEGLEVRQEDLGHTSITYQVLFRKYGHLAGMTVRHTTALPLGAAWGLDAANTATAVSHPAWLPGAFGLWPGFPSLWPGACREQGHPAQAPACHPTRPLWPPPPQGTAAPVSEELHEAYGLEVVRVPPHRPRVRVDHPLRTVWIREVRGGRVGRARYNPPTRTWPPASTSALRLGG